MTKYILVGGYPNKTDDGGKALFSALVEGKTEPVKFLECLFSRDKDSWEKSFSDDKDYLDNNIDKKIDIRYATEENFMEELKWADTVYFRGGETELLMERLSKQKGWEKLLDGKTIGGSSAGAYMLSKYYYDIVSLDIKNGLGITNTKVIVHVGSPEYKVEWDKALKELKDYKENLPTYSLAEGEFKIID